jgi:hypothetical protein
MMATYYTDTYGDRVVAREVAYLPSGDAQGTVVVANYEMRHLEIFDIFRVVGGNYWRIDTDGRPGTLAPQICDDFWTTGPTMSGESAPERQADKLYKTRRGLDNFIARAREVGCHEWED